MVKIYVVAGSVRPGRFNIQPATWIYELAKKRTDFETELIDLAEVKLPFLDEPTPPAQHKYSHEHTKKWSATIEAGDGFIFVTPEYNHSFSPVLKNAIDYLFVEWNYKPVSFVSYGSLAGGSRAVEHLRGVAAEVKMYDLREQILLPNYWEHLDAQGQYQFNDKHVAAANGIFDSLSFWAAKMKEARKELAQKKK
ncbi:NADPH-dependent FMN reductase [Hyalangium rubrum]|uniref:NAD(P)H-dependent oxidoreductase n=1 Tax=Hyalangium rubrum TaxID=3103134 RepID=A0ABU5H2V4_9BACT|nr:NAD(P)H-dependent oxidoreductase [Hyalangium sp. s54d21]MDY7227112.1 NAD(P)H-dependent oxidoreductase [Hyalangium sp. s54d21]